MTRNLRQSFYSILLFVIEPTFTWFYFVKNRYKTFLLKYFRDVIIWCIKDTLVQAFLWLVVTNCIAHRKILYCIPMVNLPRSPTFPTTQWLSRSLRFLPLSIRWSSSAFSVDILLAWFFLEDFAESYILSCYIHPLFSFHCSDTTTPFASVLVSSPRII